MFQLTSESRQRKCTATSA